jgi:hypothetical protein
LAHLSVPAGDTATTIGLGRNKNFSCRGRAGISAWT